LLTPYKHKSPFTYSSISLFGVLECINKESSFDKFNSDSLLGCILTCILVSPFLKNK